MQGYAKHMRRLTALNLILISVFSVRQTLSFVQEPMI